jgi:PAS domain S-box-containing protein
LGESEERFRSLFENAPLGYQSLDANGDFIELNETWCTLLGYTKEEVLGRNFSEFITSDFREQFKMNFPKFKSRGYIVGTEFEMIKKNGSTIRVSIDGKVGHEDNGSFKQTHCVLEDITERKRSEKERRELEQQMLQTQKLESLGVMAGGIAHDFNNILFGILGNADIALDMMASEAIGRDNLQEIKTAARRASGLTDQMLAYSGKGALVVENTDLSGLVQEMAHLLEVSHTKKSIVKCRFEENLPAMAGDASQLRQVVMNLITNASEAFGEECGFITITTAVTEATEEYLASTYANDKLPGGRYVYLEVADTGCGMDEDTQRRIFEPFFTTKFTGRGLGMAAVLGIVRAHKGAIEIQSEVDRGTTIKVIFPALTESAKTTVEEAPKDKEWTAHGTVLVVDDEPQILNLLSLLLERKGFTVLTAGDGRRATEVFREHKDEIVCVLLDLTMPRMGGEETFVELHQIRNDVPVILVSGYSEIELTERVEDLGFAGFLKKPVQSRTLLEKVRSVLNLTEGQ